MYYYVQIMGISVGGNLFINILVFVFQFDLYGNGGIIFDFGIMIMRLEVRVYIVVRDVFCVVIMYLIFVVDFKIFDMCYDFMGMNFISVLIVMFYFQGDVDMRFLFFNYIVLVSNNNIFCFVFVVFMGFFVIGNVQQ